MTEYKQKEYTPTIDAILSVADLEKVSVKKIRRAIQELFAIDLDPHKESINEHILERYYRMVDERENDKRSEKQRREEMIKSDELLALKLSKDTTSTRRRGIVKRPKVRKVKLPPVNNGFNKQYPISPELSAFLGGDTKISRPQVVKRVWDHIKQHDLQDPKDRRTIICDEKLEAVFKKKKLSMFGMNRDLSVHIYKDEDVDQDELAQPSDSSPTKQPSDNTPDPPSNASSDEDISSED